MLTMLDGKERRDCESRGFCSTQNVSANHADQTNHCDSFPSWLGLSRPSTRFSLHGARRLCRSGADSLGTGGVVGRRRWPGHRAFRRTPVLRRAMPAMTVRGCVFHAARFIRQGRPKAGAKLAMTEGDYGLHADSVNTRYAGSEDFGYFVPWKAGSNPAPDRSCRGNGLARAGASRVASASREELRVSIGEPPKSPVPQRLP